MHATDERLKELEMKVTYQDDMIESLNQVVIELRETVDMLTKRMDAIDREAPDGSDGPPPHERPPHY